MKHVFVQALLPEDLHMKLKLLAVEKKLAIKAIIKLAITNYLQTEKGEQDGKRKEIN